jgi:hypothetical protein
MTIYPPSTISGFLCQVFPAGDSIGIIRRIESKKDGMANENNRLSSKLKYKHELMRFFAGVPQPGA